MYTFSLSNDVGLIKSVVLSKNNLNYNFDDFHKPEDFEPIFNNNILYIKVERNKIFQGFFFLIMKNYTLAEAHLAFLPKAWGYVSEMGKECLIWLRNNTSVERLICPVLSNNFLALSCIKKIGFNIFDKQEKVWLKNGQWESYIWCCYNIYRD